MFVKDRMRKYSQDLFKTSMFGENMVVCCGASGHKFLFSNEKKCAVTWWPCFVDQVALSPESIENFVPEDSIKAVVSGHQIVVLTIFIWVRKHVVQNEDTVIDATCGNGYDTLVMVK
ncbi:beta-amyrin 28-monooxygenase [Quercus suber]|uniref:Beta-amyrin 28-monooxygenase n=1 Tax=Quercus suber TaxID=58331 RepID=A0AAW0JPL4_QUESU